MYFSVITYIFTDDNSCFQIHDLKMGVNKFLIYLVWFQIKKDSGVGEDLLHL